jgi:hypothetical protein
VVLTMGGIRLTSLQVEGRVTQLHSFKQCMAGPATVL